MFFFVLYLMYNVSYLFTILILGLMVMLLMLGYSATGFYVKYLVVLIYLSGIIIFILYISCLCWNSNSGLHWGILFMSGFMMSLFDVGLMSSIKDVGEYMWMFMFFSLVFFNLINVYSLLLFKVSGSLRF